MKRLLILLLGIACSLGSCKKSDSGGGTAGGDFNIGSTNYKVTSTMRLTSGNRVGYTFTSLDMQTYANATVQFFFSGNTTPAAGTYTLVDATGSGIGANQVGIQATATNSSSQTIFYQYSAAGTAQVSVNGDKVSIDMNPVGMISSVGTVQVSAHVGEMQ